MIQFFKNMKIQKRLMVSFITICTLPLLATTMIVYNYSAKAIEDAALEFAEIFNSQIVNELDRFVDEYDRVTKSILMDYDIITNISDTKELSISEQVSQKAYVQKILDRLLMLRPDIRHMVLVTEDDVLYECGHMGDSVDQELLMEQEWFQNMVQGSEALNISAVHDGKYYNSKKNRFFLTVGRKLFNAGGGYMGILLFDLEPSGIIRLDGNFLRARNDYNIRISITDMQNKILYDSDVASGRISWGDRLEENEFYDQKDSEKYLVMSTPNSKGNLHVHAVIPRSRLLMKIHKIYYIRTTSILLSVIALIIASYIISHTLTRPIKRLQMSMKKVETGQYEIVSQTEREDEIGSLVKSYNSMVLQTKNLIEKVYITEIKQKNAMILALQTQINPHMLYNTLETIRMKALVRGEDEIAEMIKILSRMFRIALKKQKAPHTIQNEIEYVENYMKLQNLRFKNRFFLEMDMQEELEEYLIIALILQPIIENCIEHGDRGHNKELHIFLSGRILESKDVLIRIRDDGKGMDAEQMKKINENLHKPVEMSEERNTTSIGLRNIAERLWLHYGEKSYLRIVYSGSEGTLVELSIAAGGLKKKEQTYVPNHGC